MPSAIAGPFAERSWGIPSCSSIVTTARGPGSPGAAGWLHASAPVAQASAPFWSPRSELLKKPIDDPVLNNHLVSRCLDLFHPLLRRLAVIAAGQLQWRFNMYLRPFLFFAVTDPRTNVEDIDTT